MGFRIGTSSTIGWFATSLVYPRVHWSAMAMWIETDDFASKLGPIFWSQDHQHWINWLSILKTGWRYIYIYYYIYSTYSSPVQESWRKKDDSAEKKSLRETPIFLENHSSFVRLPCTAYIFAIIYNIYMFTELDDGNIYRKPLYLMVKPMVSCRFSLKPIHWHILSISFPWLLAKMCVSM